VEWVVLRFFLVVRKQSDKYILLLILLWPIGRSLAEPMEITYFQTDDRYAYRIKLLKLIMESTTDTYGDYKLTPLSQKLTPERGLKLLAKGELVDIVSLPTTKQLETEFLPIKMPILKGLLGYRLLLIKKREQWKFYNINTLEELKKSHIAGFNSHWSDLKILEINGLKVLSSPLYDDLFLMLDKGRFDYFPRGLNEIYNELSKHPNLMIEPKIALYYPHFVYFFVHKKKRILAERIKLGLNRVIEKGSFDSLFNQHHKILIDDANLKNRKILELINPFIQELTPIMKKIIKYCKKDRIKFDYRSRVVRLEQLDR